MMSLATQCLLTEIAGMGTPLIFGGCFVTRAWIVGLRAGMICEGQGKMRLIIVDNVYGNLESKLGVRDVVVERLRGEFKGPDRPYL